jgi:hypothetical protein
MKKIKNICVSVFLIFMVSMYWGRCIIDNYTNKGSIENTSSTTGSQSLISSESSSEEDIPVDIPHHAVQIVSSYSESFSSPIIVFPPALYYSIWQPPKIS